MRMSAFRSYSQISHLIMNYFVRFLQRQIKLSANVCNSIKKNMVLCSWKLITAVLKSHTSINSNIYVWTLYSMMLLKMKFVIFRSVFFTKSMDTIFLIKLIKKFIVFKCLNASLLL